jgi:hypothetical protein
MRIAHHHGLGTDNSDDFATVDDARHNDDFILKKLVSNLYLDNLHSL